MRPDCTAYFQCETTSYAYICLRFVGHEHLHTNKLSEIYKKTKATSIILNMTNALFGKFYIKLIKCSVFASGWLDSYEPVTRASMTF